MSDDESIRPFGGIDTSRRSFLQKSAIASGAIALGGASVGSVVGQTGEDDPGAEGDSVLMLYPDAVENANAQVVSDEIDWLPWEDEEETGGIGGNETDDNGVGGNETNGEDEDGGIGDDENGEDGAGTGQNQEYRTHLAQFEYSASHVAPVFVPQDADVSLDDDISLGEIQEVVLGPDEPLDGAGMGTGDDGTDDGATGDDQNGANQTDDGTDGDAGLGMDEGRAVFARVALEEDTMDDGIGGEDEDDGVGTDGEDDDGPAGGDDSNGEGPGADDNESDDEDGIFDDENESEDGEEDDDDGILSLV